MLFDIRTAALDDLVEQRVRLAISLLPAYKLRGRASPWDGTRCHLLVAAADDAYGHQALTLAMRRGTPVVALGEPIGDLGVEPLNPFSTASTLAKTIRTQLRGIAPQQAETADQPAARPAICKLAMPPLRGKAVNATCNGRMLTLRPEVGRVYAASHSDLLAVADGLSGSEWEIEVVERPPSTHDMMSASIESFLLRAAHRASERLPDFPDGRYRLEAWPDLGALPSLVGALRIAKLLLRGPMAPHELARSEHHDIDRDELNACLWALAAADLLVDAGAGAPAWAPQPAPKRVQPGIWSSIARRFGLLPRQPQF